MTAPLIPIFNGTVPIRTQAPAVFANNAGLWLSYQSGIASSYNALAVYTNTVAAAIDADSTIATNSATAATAAANYKGEWNTLTGAINIPASVSHESTVWLLLENNADVTLIEPGISPKWQTLTMNASLPEPLTHLFAPNLTTKLLSSTLTTNRASSATFVDRYDVLQTVSSDVLRVEQGGALIEGASTNKQTFSEEINPNNAGWLNKQGGVGINPTFTNNFAIAPDGTQTATRVQLDLNSGNTIADQSGISSGIETVIGESIAYSIYIKNNSGVLPNLNINFNGLTAENSPNSIPITNEWVRYVFLLTGAAVLDVQRKLTIRLRGTQETSDTADILLWGGQFEALPNKTSYIKTDATAATRAADDVNFAFPANIPNLKKPFTFSTEINNLSLPLSSFGRFINSASDRFFIGISTDGAFIFLKLGNGDAMRVAENLTKSPKKLAVTFDGVNVKGYVDGVLNTTTAFNNGEILNSGLITINNLPNGTSPSNCNQKNMRLFDKALTADEVKLL